MQSLQSSIPPHLALSDHISILLVSSYSLDAATSMREVDLEGYASAITSYIKCGENVTSTRTITTQPEILAKCRGQIFPESPEICLQVRQYGST